MLSGLLFDLYLMYIVEMLFNVGLLVFECVVVFFLMDVFNGIGIVEFGGYDVWVVEEDSVIELFFVFYVLGLDYIWMMLLCSWWVGLVEVVWDWFFCYDIGLLYFKGDLVLLMVVMY